jgi:hypothetical protein
MIHFRRPQDGYEGEAAIYCDDPKDSQRLRGPLYHEWLSYYPPGEADCPPPLPMQADVEETRFKREAVELPVRRAMKSQ